MQELRPTIPPQLNSRQVLFRVIFRLVLLTALATLGSQGFWGTFAALLALSAVFCAVMGVMRARGNIRPCAHALGRGGSLRNSPLCGSPPRLTDIPRYSSAPLHQIIGAIHWQLFDENSRRPLYRTYEDGRASLSNSYALLRTLMAGRMIRDSQSSTPAQRYRWLMHANHKGPVGSCRRRKQGPQIDGRKEKCHGR